MRQAALIAVLLASGFSVVLATSKSYDVVPYGGSVAEIATSPNSGVAQYYRNTLDSLTRISWWCGDTFSGGLFNAVVADSANPLHVIAYSAQPVHAAQCWAWLDFPLTDTSRPVRGRTYKVVVTRLPWPGGPISFAYDPRNPYTYGKAVVNNSSPALPDGSDLALRVLGLHGERGTLPQFLV